jgi:hypothetical protein
MGIAPVSTLATLHRSNETQDLPAREPRQDSIKTQQGQADEAEEQRGWARSVLPLTVDIEGRGRRKLLAENCSAAQMCLCTVATQVSKSLACKVACAYVGRLGKSCVVEAQCKASTGGLSSGATGPEWVQLASVQGENRRPGHDEAEPGLGGAASRRTTDQLPPALLPFAPLS